MAIVNRAGLKYRQKGTTVVEFSIVASVLFLILFSIMEFGRVMYTFNLLQESTRSAARMAVVSERDSDDILTAAKIFMRDLEAENLEIVYLDSAGNPVTTGVDGVYFVRAAIVNYQMDLMIPLPGLPSITAPPFTTAQVAESLGENPEPETSVRWEYGQL